MKETIDPRELFRELPTELQKIYEYKEI